MTQTVSQERMFLARWNAEMRSLLKNFAEVRGGETVWANADAERRYKELQIRFSTQVQVQKGSENESHG